MSVTPAIAQPIPPSQSMMSSEVATPTVSSTPRPRNRRRGRGQANREARQTRPATSAEEPSSTSTQLPPAQPASAPSSNTQNDASRSRRGHKDGRGAAGRGRGRENGGPRRGLAHAAGQDGQMPGNQSRGMRARGFEARLTRPGQDSAAADVVEGVAEQNDQNLRADAPDFVPGQPRPPAASSASVAKGKGKAKVKPPQPQQPPKVMTKSTAGDIATRIHEDIAHNLYECPICTSELGRRSRIWSCGLCWTVFHLSCVKKWSTNQAQNASQQQQNGQDPLAPRAWRCPGCNLSHDIFPSVYSCWCEKEVDPRPLPGLPPHSCGQTCSRPRKGCPHPCDATCHAGPCTPCTSMGPTQDCFCGRNSSTKRCQDTDYENGWSCGEICGDLLPCGEHTCPLPCHEGLCGACEVKIDARCYCGKVQTEMLCSSKDEEKDSTLVHDDGTEEEWTGCFGCTDICNRSYDCGVHSCQKGCHPQESHPTHCPRSPDVVIHCPCGKTVLSEIPGFTPRSSCEDPIPNCSEPCGKMLPCGHSCDQICHTGPCGSCLRRVPIQCQCGRTTSTTICHQGNVQPPQCFRVCKTTLHCGRHACSERCCPGEQRAIERQAARRKLKPHLRPIDEDIEAEHICTRVCGRTLKCGRHTCPELCHKGACNTCREAIFEEIACNCGRSILFPPQPCGTQPPRCSFQCERPKPCGHPQTTHNCHADDEGCPKCPFLTEKECQCGKKVLKNVPCWLTDARCGQVCGQPLKCGSHSCRKDCHRPGECEDSTKPCQQTCGKTKTLCGHPCAETCHAPYPCPEKTPCSSIVTVTCSCGRLRQDKRCNAVKAVTSKGQVQQPQRMPELSPLTCDDECSRLERNRSLASALGVDINQSTTIQTITSTNLPYSSETLDQYIQLASSAPLSTLQTYESSLHSLAASTTQRSFRFQPAKSTLRAFAHSLATDWGFVTESHDPDPHRHVFVLKPLSWTPPVFGLGSSDSAVGIGGMSVRECVKLRERERNKEAEARRVAALEAKAARDALRTQSASGEGGWAQVASRGKKDGMSSASTRSTTPVPASQGLFNGGTMFAALAADNTGGGMKKKERLVLRSGIGAGKSLRAQQQANVEVVDSWEEAEEKEERVEREQEEIEADLELEPGQEKGDGEGDAQVRDQDDTVEDSGSSDKQGGDSVSPVQEESHVPVADADGLIV